MLDAYCEGCEVAEDSLDDLRRPRYSPNVALQ